MKSFYLCECIDSGMVARHGATIHLPYPDARFLQATGQIRIIDPALGKKREALNTDYLFRKNWLDKRLTRIAWVQNYCKNGGAEISNFNAIATGGRLGFDVIGWILGGQNAGYDLLNSADLIIVNNLHVPEESGKADFLKWLFGSGKPFVKYEHDCLGDNPDLYTKSLLNIFISPKHFKFYLDKFGEGLRGNSVVLPLAFDVSRFSNHGRHSPGTVFIPSYEKCRDNIIDFIHDNPQYRYFVAGGMAPAGKNVQSLGYILYDEMQKYYAQYQMMYHCPTKLWAGDRVLFEAVLCGCQVITNENAGHSSWEIDWRNAAVLRPWLNDALYDFWRQIDKVVT